MPLLSNIDWSAVKCIIVYCEEFYADLGHFKVSKPLTFPNKPAVPPSPRPKPKPQKPSSSLQDLDNCAELIPGYFNAHWETSGGAVTLGLEGRPGAGNRWMAFGFSPAGSPGPVMVGSDVVIAGIVAGKCFAYNYRLSAKSQCDFTTASGVCPDFAGTSPLKLTTSTKLLACDRVGDKLSVLVRRPLGASDGKNNAWPVRGSRFTVFAMGPVSEGSNATVPVVLYHSLQLPGLTEASSVTSSLAGPKKIALSPIKSGNNCRKIVPMVGGNSPGGGPPSGGGKVNTIDGPTAFTITIGSNKNYPNPPGWGYSLWVNGRESPVLVARRGTTYTFTIAAGPTHPVYITSSVIGGGSLVRYKGEKVFAGSSKAFGTPQSPKTFTWTPDASTPGNVYYQCTVHQKLGWQIKVVDSDSTRAATPPPAVDLTTAQMPAQDSSSSTAVNTPSDTGSTKDSSPVDATTASPPVPTSFGLSIAAHIASMLLPVFVLGIVT